MSEAQTEKGGGAQDRSSPKQGFIWTF